MISQKILGDLKSLQARRLRSPQFSAARRSAATYTFYQFYYLPTIYPTIKTKRIHLFTIAILCLFCAATLSAQDKSLRDRMKAPPPKSRDITIEKINSDKADFTVAVKLNRKNLAYTENELLSVSVNSNEEGYLYLVHISSTGKKTLLIPNEFQADNKIQANNTVKFPAADADFQFRVTGPNFGQETIKAFVTKSKLGSVAAAKFTQAPVTALDEDDTKAILKELGSKDIVVEGTQKPDKPQPVVSSSGSEMKFATHQVVYTTRAKKDSSVTAKPRRFAVCFGVNKYSDPNIKNLMVCARDAKLYAEMLVKYCGVAEEDCFVYTDEEVTVEKVKEIFCDVLPGLVPPGSVVFFYWSGHGNRMAATKGDSSTKSYASYLVPYSGDLGEPENTMLMEGPFGMWVQNLNNCKLFFVLDACYSGGMTERAKSVGGGDKSITEKEQTKSLLEMVEKTSAPKVTEKKPTEPKSLLTAFEEKLVGSKSVSDDSDEEESIDFRFGFNRFAQAKALGQTGLAVIASSSDDQLSWEREEEDFSVMTYFLVKTISKGPKGITHTGLKEKVSREVDEYLKSTRPNTKQTVVVQDELTPELVLKVKP